MKLTQILFRVLYVLGILLSVFTVTAPREIVLASGAYLWGWLVMLVPVRWLVLFVRSLYRGGE